MIPNKCVVHARESKSCCEGLRDCADATGFGKSRVRDERVARC